MEHQPHNSTVIKNYTFTTLLSFCIIFFLFVMMSNCKGDYKMPSAHHNAAIATPTNHH